MERPWLILARVIRVVPAEAQAGVQLAAAGDVEGAGEEQAEDAAVQQAEELAAVGEAEDAGDEQTEDAAVEQAAVAAAQAEVELAADGGAEDAGDEQANLEAYVVNADAVAVAVAVADADFTVSVAPPPRVTFLTARANAQPGVDMYPCIIATGSFCLLAHLATPPDSGTDFRRVVGCGSHLLRPHHLILLRYFRRLGGEIVATAVRVPDRPRFLVSAMRNIESIGLVCDGDGDTDTYNYRIAELVVDTGRQTIPKLELAIFRSDRNLWFTPPELASPLAHWDRTRAWNPHGAVAVLSTVMWFDLSWGVLSCNVYEQELEDFHVAFCRLPRGRRLKKGAARKDIHTRRCMAASRDMLRYVEIIVADPDLNAGAPTVCMWTLQMGDEGYWRWIANYRVSFGEIWSTESYARTGLQQAIPVLAGVCPANSDVVYFDLHHLLFGVNVPERQVVDYEANPHALVNVPGGEKAPESETGSSRYLVTWNLLRQGRAEPADDDIGHVSPDLPDDGSAEDKDEEPQDPKGKSKAKDGRRKSTSARSSRPSKALRIK